MAETQEVLIEKIKEQGDLVRKLKAAKESSEKVKATKSTYDLQQLDRHLSEYSYLCGYTPGKIDIDVIKKIGDGIDFNKYKYLKRWWYHMRSFSDSEISKFSRICPHNFKVLDKTSQVTDEKVFGDVTVLIRL